MALKLRKLSPDIIGFCFFSRQTTFIHKCICIFPPIREKSLLMANEKISAGSGKSAVERGRVLDPTRLAVARTSHISAFKPRPITNMFVLIERQ